MTRRYRGARHGSWRLLDFQYEPTVLMQAVGIQQADGQGMAGLKSQNHLMVLRR